MCWWEGRLLPSVLPFIRSLPRRLGYRRQVQGSLQAFLWFSPSVPCSSSQASPGLSSGLRSPATTFNVPLHHHCHHYHHQSHNHHHYELRGKLAGELEILSVNFGNSWLTVAWIDNYDAEDEIYIWCTAFVSIYVFFAPYSLLAMWLGSVVGPLSRYPVLPATCKGCLPSDIAKK